MEYNHNEAMNRILMKHFKSNMMSILGNHTHEPLFLESVNNNFKNDDIEIMNDDKEEEINEINDLDQDVESIEQPSFSLQLQGNKTNIKETTRKVLDEMAKYLGVINAKNMSSKIVVLNSIKMRLTSLRFPEMPDINMGKMKFKKV
jgi:hypothetical protein